MAEHPPEFLACYPASYGRTLAPQKPDYDRCCARVYDDKARARYQCKRKNGHGERGAYCATHDPEKIRAKSNARSSAYEAKWAIERRQSAFVAACQQAIRDIAAGHNDPRGLAQSILDQLNSTPTKETTE